MSAEICKYAKKTFYEFLGKKWDYNLCNFGENDILDFDIGGNVCVYEMCKDCPKLKGIGLEGMIE